MGDGLLAALGINGRSDTTLAAVRPALIDCR